MTAPVENDAEPVDWTWIFARLRSMGLRSADIAELTDREIFDQYLWADVDEQGRPKPRKRVSTGPPGPIAEKAPQNDEEKYALLIKSGLELGIPEATLQAKWAEYLKRKAASNGS